MGYLPLWYLCKISGDTCNQIIADMSGIKPCEALMGAAEGRKDHATRNSQIGFGSADYWLNDQLENFAMQANKECKWEYHVTGRENIQFAEYGPDQHYAWHTDTFALSGEPTDRKLTVICLLNDEFEGGQFQIRLGDEHTVPLEKGTIVAFPSILEHRVIPVTSGVRYSATMWFYGPRFR
jgi:PKHD-type hydroxylase